MSDTETLTVSELCDQVSAAINATFDREIWVQGAISGISRSNNGHVYFDLIEPTEGPGGRSGAVLPVALFESNRKLVNKIMVRSGGIRMSDGIEIRIRGRVTYYVPQGRVQLVMSLIDPQYTLGQMVMAKQQLLDALREEGLLAANGAVPLPLLPLKVALVTSDGSAAYHDFVRELTACRYPFAITLFDARVQGEDAVPSLVSALEAAPAAGADVVVLIRGGGARTDLACFDHERLARRIAACPLPVVVGVGHETDRSVADEVANTSTKTPTAAARHLIDLVQAFDHHTLAAADRLAALAETKLERARVRLLSAGTRLASSAQRAADRERLNVDHAAQRITRASALATERQRSRLETIEARLAGHDPANALRRGWTITSLPDGRPVRSPADVSLGDTISTLTAAGRITSSVTAAESATVAEQSE